MSSSLSDFPVSQSRFCRDEGGATALEWSVLASCIAAVAVVGIASVGQTLARMFEQAADIIIGAIL